MWKGWLGPKAVVSHYGEIVRNFGAENPVSCSLINKVSHVNMKFTLRSVSALLLCISVTAHAAATGDFSPDTTASKFADALQHKDFKKAAAMFAPGQAQDLLLTERTLTMIDEALGGFSAMRLVPTLPDGKSIKLTVPAQKSTAPKTWKFLQFRYASTASDGQPVFYELNLTADDTPPRVLSFSVCFPVSDEQSTARANNLTRLMSR